MDLALGVGLGIGIAAIIVVPSNFDAALASGDAPLDLYLNNVDIDLSDDIRRSVTRSVGLCVARKAAGSRR